MKRLIVISGPSGIGKSYLAEKLLGKYPTKFSSVKIFTTRVPRPNENALDRIFISERDFLAKKIRMNF